MTPVVRMSWLVVILMCACSAGAPAVCTQGCAEDERCIGGECRSTAPPGTCLGGACAADSDCGMGQRCNRSLDMPRCQKLYCGPLGSLCNNKEELCSQDLTCEDSICVMPGGEWDTCGWTPGLVILCAPGLVCRVDYHQLPTPYCRPPGTLGEGGDCRKDAALCAASYACENNKCVPIPGAGEPCTDDDECIYPLRCETFGSKKECRSTAEPGQPCKRTPDCKKGSCAQGVCSP